jgi:hypothetical protein
MKLPYGQRIKAKFPRLRKTLQSGKLRSLLVWLLAVVWFVFALEVVLEMENARLRLSRIRINFARRSFSEGGENGELKIMVFALWLLSALWFVFALGVF